MKNLLSASTLLLCLSGFTAAKQNDLFQPLQQLASKGSSNATLDARSLVKRACDFGEVICDVNYCVDTSDVCCGDGNGAYCYEGQKCCSNSDYCAPDDGVCCGSLGSCPNGYECATVDGEPGCCPESGCSSFGLDDDDDLVDLDDDDVDDTDVTVYTQVIYWYVYVYWYVEIWYYIEVDTETSTLSLTSSEERTSSTATVTASNSRDASSQFESISESVTEAATTTPDLDSIPTSTTTTDSTSGGSSTPTATGTSGDDDDDDDSNDSNNTIDIDDLLSGGEPTPSPTDDAASTLGSSEALWYTGIFNAFLGLFVLL
ncbi:hypothetical protein BJX65DRAFT_143160 [Aspergillus insuetus]